MIRFTPSSILLLPALSALVACGASDDNDQNDQPVVIIIEEPECSAHKDCASSEAGPVCADEVCVAGCLKDADCTEGDETECDQSANRCIKPEVIEPQGCSSDEACEGDPAGPICDVASGACGPFVCTADTDCQGDEPVCDLGTGACRAGCLSDEACTDEALPLCNMQSRVCVAAPAGSLLGRGEVSEQSVEFVKIYEPTEPIESTDLEFHPERNELWVLNREFEVPGACVEANFRSARVANSLWGSTTIITSPGSFMQRAEVRTDGNAWHFMRRPTSFAMGARDTFATCGEAATGNFEDNDGNFIGPTLWSSDLAIYAQPSGGNGSHLDMLHATPWCMGIAHERDNVYWAFNGDVGAIDRYDFHEDHGPGADDHSDGEIFRYIPGELERVPNVPSHMVFNPDDAHLYVVDTGHARLIKLDTTVGTLGGPFTPVYEPLANYGFMQDTAMVEVVTDQGLVEPSGLALYEGALYVSDHATGMLHAFDLAGNPLRSLQTPLGEGSLAGITVGPNKRLWFTDMKTGAVYVIRPLK